MEHTRSYDVHLRISHDTNKDTYVTDRHFDTIEDAIRWLEVLAEGDLP